MQDHITKPIDPEQFYDRLRHWGGRSDQAVGRGAPHSAPDQTKAAAHDWPPHQLPPLSGFDLQGGLRRVAGNGALYRRLLLSMLRTQGEAASGVSEALARDAFQEAERIVHTLKGVAANLGATALADAAGCLEHELKQGQCSDGLMNHFVHQHQLTLDTLRQAFDRLPDVASDGDALPAQRDALTSDQIQVLHVLERYLSACDGEALEMVDSEQLVLCEIMGGASYDELAQNVRAFDFAAARQLLLAFIPPASLNSSQD
jgi:HPt (histidine-containing phosphotransfer) domain-containing protein